MKERFEADDGVLLISALARHFDGGGIEVAKAISKAGDLIELSVGDVLISEASEDNDIYFIISGTVSVVVKGQQIRTLRPGDHVGEMAAIEPSLPRSASVIADSTLVAVKMTEGAFATIANTFPSIIWKSIAQELARRLNDRNRLMSSPNEKPRMFIISSVEGLEVARELQVGLQYDVLATVWTDGVFWAGGYPLEALEGAVSESDFGVAVALFEDLVETARGERTRAMRDNVLFELGMFMGRLGRRRSILVFPRHEGLILPSDLQGLTPASYHPGASADLPTHLGPVCSQIRKIVNQLGVKIPEN